MKRSAIFGTGGELVSGRDGLASDLALFGVCHGRQHTPGRDLRTRSSSRRAPILPGKLAVKGLPASLAAQIKELLPRLRQIAGEDRKPTLCFDRGGWSPDLFADIIHAGFHLLTYRKNTAGKEIPELPAEEFSVVSHASDGGRPREYELAESEAELAITKGERKGKTVKLRQVTRRDKGRQVHILTSRQAGDLPAADVIYRMGSRWREENYFRYGRAHFALDALDSYAVTPEDPDRKAPAPQEESRRRRQDRQERPRRRRGSPRREAHRPAQPRPRPARRRHHQPDARKVRRPGRRRTPQAPRRPGRRQGHPRQDRSVRAQPRHGPPGHRDQADHSRHPDGRVQRRDHPRPCPGRLLLTRLVMKRTP